MASNTIKLFPLDQNQIALLDTNEIILVESSPELPGDFEFNSGSTLIGGDDIKKAKKRSSIKTIERSGGAS